MVPNKKLDNYLKKIASGNKEALADLYKDTKTALYGYILSMLANKTLAEETLQDTYIKIWENAYLYKSQEKPLAWIFTIAKNLSLMKIRKEKQHIDVDDLKEILSNSKDNIENKLFLSYLFKHIKEDERTIVLLHTVAGFKHREIAKMMNISLGTVLSKYKRVIDKLKQIDKEDNDEK